MSHSAIADTPAPSADAAQRLRRLAAAVRVQFKWWGVHRTLTTQQKEQVGLTYDADGRLLTAGKKLIDVRHESFRKLTSIRTQAVAWWRGRTLPYVEAGIRLIRRSDIDEFVRTMEAMRSELIQAEGEFNAVFSEIKLDAKRRLGRLFDDADYPDGVRGLFDVAWEFPSTDPPNYLLQISPELYQQEQDRVVRRFEEAVRLAERAFLDEFAQLVTHLSERLEGGADGKRKTFRDTAITNLTEFFERFRHLNVQSNGELDRLIEQAQALVGGVSPQTLRDDDHLRCHVATQLSQVQSQLDGLMVDKPRRRIIRPTASTNGVMHATDD